MSRSSILPNQPLTLLFGRHTVGPNYIYSGPKIEPNHKPEALEDPDALGGQVLDPVGVGDQRNEGLEVGQVRWGASHAAQVVQRRVLRGLSRPAHSDPFGHDALVGVARGGEKLTLQREGEGEREGKRERGSGGGGQRD